jgi:CARDB
MTCSPMRFVVSSVGALVMSLAVATAASAGGQNNPGPAPSVTAIDSGVPAEPFHPSTHGPVAAPSHPPIGLVPPMPMPNNPNWGAARPANSGPGQGVVYNATTGQEVRGPLNPEAAAAAYTTGGGYPGADGGIGNEQMPASMGSMSLLSAATRAAFPYRMNVKLLMRFGNSYFVCSGSMRDANVVLTAGHCVNNGAGGAWADEIWVYPAWDGAGSLFGPPSIVNPYGWAHSTTMASWTGWTVSGDFNFDIGAVAIDRAAGFLTGWFGWAYGGDCNFATTTNYNSASYPAESCSATLHTGADMYIWGGTFNSCPNTNRLGLNTTGGCLGAVWGGMSGSGAYYFDANNNRFTHAITSTSNRSTYAEYTRQWLDWVNYLNGTFDPINAQGANFNLQPLNVVGPATFTAGTSTGGLTHLAANTSTAARNTNYTFRVYLSSNDDVSSTDTLLSTQSYGWNFGGVSAVTVNMGAVTIPANTPPGTYYLGVIYDNATDTNAGDNDSDGWDALRITVVSADVSVSALSAPASFNPGQTFNVSNTVVNNGNAATGNFRLGLYLSTDNVCTTADTLIGNRTVSLGSGGSSAANTSVTIPAGATFGAAFICAIADDTNVLGEYNESNNTRFTGVNILSAVPTVTLKVNGLHPTPPVVATSGPYNLTITIPPTSMTGTLDSYWALIVNGSLFWITPSGASTIPAPFMHGPAPVWTDFSLINVALPHGVTITSAYFILNGGSVVSSDFITAQTPASANATN